MNIEQFRVFVVQPVLKRLDMGGLDAEELMIATAVQESGGLKYIRQLGGGPALSFFQIEPATEKDVIDNYVKYRPDLLNLIETLRFSWSKGTEHELLTNMAYATAIARLCYRRQREPLPDKNDVMGMGKYWKRYYNTLHGKGTVNEFIHNYNHYVLGK